MICFHNSRSSGFAARLLVVALLCTSPVFAAEPAPPAGQLLPTNDVVAVELAQPMALWNHPLVRAVRDNAAKSRLVQSALSTPQFDRVLFVQQLLESAGGERWDATLAKLTAGGVSFSVTPGNGGSSGLTLIVTANNAATLSRFVETLKEQVDSRLPQQQRGKLYVPATKDGHEFVRVGPAAYAIVGRQLILGSTERRLLDALKKHRKATAAKRETKSTPSPAIHVTVNIKQIRQTPYLQNVLQIPGTDVGRMALLGGWIDLIRRSDRITVGVVPVGQSLEITAVSTADQKGTITGLQGYFADGQQTTIAPLLELPDTLYAASWYRDYRSLWNQRANLVTKKPLQKLEEGDETVRKQLSVIGAKSAPSRAFSLFGPHIRVVVARQPESEYRLELSGRFPAAALCVDIRDESAFNAEVVPFLRGVSLILAIGEQKMMTRKSTYKGAELASLRFRDDEVSAKSGNRVRFNFSPTYAVTRGHFIAASSETMVQRVIDELDRQSKQSVKNVKGATELQRLSLKHAAAALRDMKSSVAATLVFDAGFSIDDAKTEFDLLARVLESVGEMNADAGYQSDGFRYRIRIGRRETTTAKSSTGNSTP